VADSHDSAVVDVILELKQTGLDVARDLKDQLVDLNAAVKDVNSSLEKMSDRLGADMRSMVELAVASLAGAKTMSAVRDQARDATPALESMADRTRGAAAAFLALAGAQLIAASTAITAAITGPTGWAQFAMYAALVTAALLVFVPEVILAAGALVMFAAAVATISTVMAIGLGTIGALAAGVIYLGNRTVAGSAALTELKADLTAMADVLSKQATPMMIQMVSWVDQFIPRIQQMGSQVITWFGQRLPAMLSFAKSMLDSMAEPLAAVAREITKVADTVLIADPRFKAFFASLAETGGRAIVGLLDNLLNLSQWFLDRLPQLAAVAQPIFGTLGTIVQTVGRAFDGLMQALNGPSSVAAWNDSERMAGHAGLMLGGKNPDSFVSNIQSALDKFDNFLNSKSTKDFKTFWENVAGAIGKVNDGISLFNKLVSGLPNPSGPEQVYIKPGGILHLGNLADLINQLRTQNFHASGLNYVPYDNYPAILHKGERVLTAQQAQGGGAGTNVTVHVHGSVTTERDLAITLREQIRRLDMAQKGGHL
jgi:hypothetical protein